MAHETPLSERTIINHLPSASPDWAWRWQQGRPRTKVEPWAEADATRRRLRELADRYQTVPTGHPLIARTLGADPPPLELWFSGQLPDPPYLSVVGPRQPSEAARQLVQTVVRRLAGQVTVVSGLARGIDTVALTTAVEAGGRVLAIVPEGLDEVARSPSQLARRILQSGALVAERLFVSRLSKSHFLFRNRLLAGVADAVYLPEAAERSGTFNTVTHALKQGVDVLVTPGEVGRLTTAGSNRLIREGATVILEAADVALALGLSLSPVADSDLAGALRTGPKTVDEIAVALGWSLSTAIRELAQARSQSLVEQDWLGRYRLLADRARL